MESVTHVLRELHVPPSRIHIERFQSLDENPFDDGRRRRRLSPAGRPRRWR